MARKKKKKPYTPRNWAAVAAWSMKSEPHEDKRRKRERKYPQSRFE